MLADDDASLVEACRRGDAAAWETLVRRYQRLLYAIPRHAGLSEDGVADVFQRVCVLLLEHIAQIKQPERIGAWLATTARRESWRQSQRARRSMPFASGEDTQELQIADTALLPEELVERLEQQHTVRLALGSLDLRCRTLLTMLFYQVEPPPYSVIAAQLGVSEGSIGPTRARCLQKLRQKLETSTI